MRKFLISLLLLSAANMSSLYAEDDPVILHPKPIGNGQGHGNKPRTPIAMPEVYIDGYTLTFDASCIGCPITFVDEEENAVYTTYVDETGTVELPHSLTGTFELELVRGSITFVGEIEL